MYLWSFQKGILNTLEVAHNQHRNQEYENDVILEGRPINWDFNYITR